MLPKTTSQRNADLVDADDCSWSRYRPGTQLEAQEPNPPQAAPLVLAPILKLGGGESEKPAKDWMGRLLAEIKKSRDEQIAAGKQDSAPDAD